MMTKNKVLVTGITGQLGFYITQLLLEQGYCVHGIVRRTSTFNTSNITPFLSQIRLFEGDITDSSFINNLIQREEYDQIYHLAAQSHVQSSFSISKYTLDTLIDGTLNVLDAVRLYSPHTRVLHSGSSEQFGDNVDKDGFQRETTPFCPNSPYAVGKVAAFNLTKLYRDAYDLFVCSTLCFNMTSPKRTRNFVCRKVTDYVANLYLGNSKEKLKLGNLDASRDWTYAADSARGMYLVLNHTHPDDFVIASGQTYTIKDLLDCAFSVIHQDWKSYVEIDEELKRPKEVPMLLGDASKARKELGWTPQVTFKELIKKMIFEEIHGRVPSEKFFDYEKH
jgi:GDPmannose 4,6-dehydratase